MAAPRGRPRAGTDAGRTRLPGAPPDRALRARGRRLCAGAPASWRWVGREDPLDDNLMLELVRLLQLASPALPVGAYTYSQGLEWAVGSGVVKDEAGVETWVGDVLALSIASFEAPLVGRLMAAWRAGEDGEVARLNGDFLASRETAELRPETEQMGYSCVRLPQDLPAFAALPGWAARLAAVKGAAFPTAWSCAAAAWDIPPEMALTAYLWAWLENQIMAAVKAVPLGQSAGQRLLAGLGARIPDLAAAALTMPEQAWSNHAPGLALASSRHETQYSRLFRSL